MCVAEVVDQADVIPGKWCRTGCTCVRAPSTSTQSSTSVTPSTSTIMTTPTSTAFKECETKTPCAKRQGVCLPLEAGCSTEVIGRGRPFCADDTCQCCLEISTSTESSTSVTTSPSTTTATTSTPVEECETTNKCQREGGTCRHRSKDCGTKVLGVGQPFCTHDKCICCESEYTIWKMLYRDPLGYYFLISRSYFLIDSLPST
ncbi:uncharacterized protein LOC143030509 [Oratosquilla oratoria]|uniref:uncharacterized protein LOC143030509 n=1 Tax=Oratosquilla oratoria TaxID=337810 RepID=UPI003F75CAF3